MDEFSLECLAARVKRKLSSIDVIDILTNLFILREPPAFIRSDNGPELAAKEVRAWIETVGAETTFIEPGSPWANSYVESFSARQREVLLDGEIFYSLKQLSTPIELSPKVPKLKSPLSVVGDQPFW